MSTLSYRNWDLWLNTRYFAEPRILDGYFECTVLDGLMGSNNVEFFAEGLSIHSRKFVDVARASLETVRAETTTSEGARCIRLYEQLDTSQDMAALLNDVRGFVEALALVIDAPLPCHAISFVSTQDGKVLQAVRRSIGRGLAFEVDERGAAKEKLRCDLAFYSDRNDANHLVGRRHYMTGMQLLNLEDQMPGLLDAAFMQFYQGCEVLCRDDEGKLEASKKFIAAHQTHDSKDLQIVAHQIWRVRNKYFGHGDLKRNIYANANNEQAAAVAKQVLVARYLCRRLIDLSAPSGINLSREMGLIFETYSGHFSGGTAQLLRDFRVPFDGPRCQIWDAQGQTMEIFTFPP